MPDLHQFFAQQSEDEVKIDLELWCSECDSLLCDIEAGDNLGVLVNVARDHICNP